MLYFIWFEVGVISRELGFQQSALSATELYVLALLVWPLQSLLSLLVSHSDPLFSPIVPPLCLCFIAAAAVGRACK